MNFISKYISIVCLLVISNTAFSQISSNKDSIIFNATNELSKDSAVLFIKNYGKESIKIDSLVFFKTYSSYAFSSNFSKATINANDSAEIKIYFHPKHNINHNSELLIITEPSAYSLSIDLKGQGKYSKTYYNQTENKTEDQLKGALKAIITAGYVSLGYNSARDKMFMEFDNQKTNGQAATVNTLECVYTGRKAVGYTDRTDAQNSANFNTEHTFPQGFFNQDEPMRSDLYHLFPTDANANNSRGNFPFGIASTPYQNDATNFPSHLGSNNLYEPRDVHKGNVARAMMYFVIRYSDYANHFAPQENILRAWHNQYTPSEIEKKRNDAIALLQKNRNPFIDYPQFNERITKIIGTSNALIVPSIYFLDSIQVLTLSDTIDSVTVYVPIINNGNKKVKISNGISTIDFVKMNFDSLNINIGESAYLPVTIYTKDTSGIFDATIQFNTDFSLVQSNFNLRFVINKIAVGINNEKQNEIKIFPNPSSNYIFIESKNTEQYEIYNSIGQIIIKGELLKGINKIELQDITSGILFIKTDNKIHKIIKQ
jgi:endonuclease I